MEHKNFPSKQAIKLRKRMANKQFRDTYVASQNRTLLAHQMRGFRGAASQAEFGRLLGKPQSVVSRFEDADYGKWTLQSLHEVASKTDRALLIQFVSFEEFLTHVEKPSRYDVPAAYRDLPPAGIELLEVKRAKQLMGSAISGATGQSSSSFEEAIDYAPKSLISILPTVQ